MSPNRKLNWNKLLSLALVALMLILSPVMALANDQEEIQLPDDYIYKQIYTPTVAGLSGLVISQNGMIYVRHLGPDREVRVSQLDIDQDSLTRVLTLPPWAGAHSIVGGPGDSFFIDVAGEVSQVQSDGSYTVWNNSPPAGMLEYYTQDGRMLGIGDGGHSVLQIFPDGTSLTLLSGLSMVYDIIAATDGTIFIVDFPAGELIRLKDGSSSVVTTIVQDNTDLAIDQNGNLYINNANSGFAQIDLGTGLKTRMFLSDPPCPFVYSPGLVLFDSTDRAIFGSWVENKLSWANFSSDTGGQLISQSWANTSAADLGPDDNLYLGVNGCGTVTPTQIVRFDVDGQHLVVLDGLTGNITGFALDESGGFYISLATESSAGTYYVASGLSTPVLVPGTAGQEVGALAVDPISGDLFAYRGTASQVPPAVTISEFSAQGETQYQVAVPKAPAEFLLDFGPDGGLYAYISEAERFFSGPVDRWTLSIDIEADTYTELAYVPRLDGCCPFGSLGVDNTGLIWWLLNPDSLLYQVNPMAGQEPFVFASNLPADAGYANCTKAGNIFLNTPEGLYRIWQPTAAERVEMVSDIVNQLVGYGELSAGQGQALVAKLEAVAASLERGQLAVAKVQVHAFLSQLRALTQAGLLDEAPADLLITAVDTYITPYVISP